MAREQSGAVCRFNVLLEVIQDGLPTLPLLLDRIGCLGVEGLSHRDGVVLINDGQAEIGQIVKVRITDSLDYDLIGEIVQ